MYYQCYHERMNENMVGIDLQIIIKTCNVISIKHTLLCYYLQVRNTQCMHVNISFTHAHKILFTFSSKLATSVQRKLSLLSSLINEFPQVIIGFSQRTVSFMESIESAILQVSKELQLKFFLLEKSVYVFQSSFMSYSSVKLLS